MPQKWYWVSLPHTWNDIDGQDGGNDLYRGTSFYAKELEKIDLPKDITQHDVVLIEKNVTRVR